MGKYYYLCTANLQKYRNITKKIAIKITKIYTIMKDFLAQTGMTVLEEREFKLRITDPNREFHFTKDKFHNRTSGRTAITPAERVAMLNTLEEMRKEKRQMFEDWAADYFCPNGGNLDKLLFKSDVYDSYVAAVGIDNAYPSLFWRGLGLFAIDNKLVFNPEQMRGYQKEHGRIVISTIRDDKRATYEFIYMQSEGAPINNELPQA